MCVCVCVCVCVCLCVSVCACVGTETPGSVIQFCKYPYNSCLVGWGCRIHRLHLYRGVRPPHNECPVYDTRQTVGELAVILGFGGMQSTPSLPLHPGPFWPVLVAPVRALCVV